MKKKQGKGAKVAKGATVAKVTTSKAAKPEGKQPEKASAKAEKPQAAQLGKGATLEEKIKARCAKMGINPNKVIVATVSAKPEAKPEAAKVAKAAEVEAKAEKPEAAKYKAVFKVGETYAARSICDSDCIFQAVVIKRTAKTVTFREQGRKDYTCGISKGLSAHCGCEAVYPHGNFSMCPTFRADRTLADVLGKKPEEPQAASPRKASASVIKASNEAIKKAFATIKAEKVIKAAEVEAKAAKPEAAKAKPEDDARFNDWLREIEGLVLNGRLAEITAEKIARAQGAANLASREAVLLCLAQVAKLTKDERPKAKRIGELLAKITEARAKELKARWAMGADMPREALKPGVAVVVQHPYKDKRMACMVDTFQACDWSWDKSEGKFQVLTMAWTEEGKPEAKQKAPSKPQGKQGKPEAKQGKPEAASPQKAVKAAKAKGEK